MCAAPPLTLTVRDASTTRTLTTHAVTVTIGRGADCTLVLADPRRTISRVQARIDWRDGQCVLTDTGSNPMLVNGRIVDASREAVLHDADTLRIGDYRIEIGIGIGAASVDGDATTVIAARSGESPDIPTLARLPGRPRK
jgi:type VI secretion system protein